MTQDDSNTNTLVFGQFDDRYSSMIAFVVTRSESIIGDVEAYMKLKEAVSDWVEKTFEGSQTYAGGNGVTILDILPHTRDSLMPFLREKGLIDLTIIKGHIGNPLPMDTVLTERSYRISNDLLLASG